MSDALDRQRYGALRRLVEDEKHRFVVAFGGGSIPGLCGNLALARILEELDLRGRVAEVWGTSAGAVAGSGWATGTPALEILDLVRSLDRRGAVDFSKLRLVGALVASMWPLRRPLPDGLIRGARFWATIDAGLRVKTFEECEIPFRCIACTDDGRAQRKVFRRGPLLPAVFASMTIPGIITPQPVAGDGAIYYDGGLVEKSPLLSPIADHKRRGDGRKLVLLCTHFSSDKTQARRRGFHQRFLDTIFALEDLAWGYQLAEARQEKDVVLLLLNPHLDDAAMFGFGRAQANYAQARERFADALQDAKIAQTFGTV
jgi:predicted acylesterase/phospholipase RssA